MITINRFINMMLGLTVLLLAFYDGTVVENLHDWHVADALEEVELW